MSTSDHPEARVLDPKVDHHSGATAASPQDSQSLPKATEKESAPVELDPGVGPSTSAAPSDHASSGDAAGANHPATGGESAAPAMATAISTTTTPADNIDTSTQTKNIEPSPMDTHELNTGTSPDQSEETPGKEVEDVGPSLDITLLLTTGSRHPFTIDGKYLRKRSVNVEKYDPFAMSVYTLKELIWREWRSGK